MKEEFKRGRVQEFENRRGQARGIPRCADSARNDGLGGVSRSGEGTSYAAQGEPKFGHYTNEENPRRRRKAAATEFAGNLVGSRDESRANETRRRE
jgi:hypothetical protein